jgi:hypothetical protein
MDASDGGSLKVTISSTGSSTTAVVAVGSAFGSSTTTSAGFSVGTSTGSSTGASVGASVGVAQEARAAPAAVIAPMVKNSRRVTILLLSIFFSPIFFTCYQSSLMDRAVVLSLAPWYLLSLLMESRIFKKYASSHD